MSRAGLEGAAGEGEAWSGSNVDQVGTQQEAVRRV